VRLDRDERRIHAGEGAAVEDSEGHEVTRIED